MVTFKSISEELVKKELQKQITDTIMSISVKWTKSEKLFKSFEGRYRLHNTVGFDKNFSGFINEKGKVTIITK